MLDIERKKAMISKKMAKLVYAITVAAIITILSIACSASAVWGS